MAAGYSPLPMPADTGLFMLFCLRVSRLAMVTGAFKAPPGHGTPRQRGRDRDSLSAIFGHHDGGIFAKMITA